MKHFIVNFNNKFWVSFVIVALLFQSVSPTLGVTAKSDRPIQSDTLNTDQGFANGTTIGSEIAPEDRMPSSPVPDFAKQVAEEAKARPATTTPLRLKVSAAPAIYIPGKPIRIQWSLDGLADAALGAKHPQLSIQAPVGVTPTDPTVKAGINVQGLLNVSESSLATGQIEWLVGATAKFPLTFSFSLQRDGKVLDEKGILVDTGKFSLPVSGGSIDVNQGWVKVNVPAGALTQPIALDVRDPSPQQMPPVSLTGYPIEIVAAGKTDGKDVKHFHQPIRIQMQYDPVSLVYPNSQDTLTMYYYDEEAFDWIPLPTSVDTIHHTLTAESDHLTVFDYKAGNWQTNSLPGIDSFKVSDFTGAATYGVSIWTPPGPGGLQPSISLSYNSQVIDESMAFSQASWVGMGWSLETGSITRNMHGTDTDLTDDTFNISAGGISGMLLPIGSNVSKTIISYNTADQSYANIQFDTINNRWTVLGKDGTKYIFDRTARTNRLPPDDKHAGCVTAESGLDLTWQWSLSSTTDTSGNQLTYGYHVEKKSERQKNPCWNEIAVYPETILYPNGRYRVRFVRDSTPRKDYDFTWDNNSSRTLYGTYKLSKIFMDNCTALPCNVSSSTNWTPIRQYVLTYAPDNEKKNIIYPNFLWNSSGGTPDGKTLTLVGIQEKSGDATDQDQCSTPGTCLPAVSFTYGDNMHITAFNNGQGGSVAIKYEPWQYADDINDRLRSLLINYGPVSNPKDGTVGCFWKDNVWDAYMEWTPVSGPSRCWNSLHNGSLLEIGLDRTVNNVIVQIPATVERSIPQYIAKPGARYRIAMTGMSQRGSTLVRWIMKDTNDSSKSTHKDWSVNANLDSGNVQRPYTFVDDFVDLPINYNPNTTKLQIYCVACWLKKIQFAVYPSWYRVTSRTVLDAVTHPNINDDDPNFTYTYQYDNPAPNTLLNSEAINTASNTPSPFNWDKVLYTPQQREYRGNAMSMVLAPNNLATLTWYHQSDFLKGRAYHTLTAQKNFYESFDQGFSDNWVAPKGNSVGSANGVDFDSQAYTKNTKAIPISLDRKSATITDGQIVVAHFRLSGESAQAQVGLSSSSQFFGVFMSKAGFYLQNANDTWLMNANLDKWYVIEFFVNGMDGLSLHLWQEDDPASSIEATLPMSSTSWMYHQQVSTGTLALDTYFEGVPFSEGQTKYETVVQYKNKALATDEHELLKIPRRIDLSAFQDLSVAWTKPIESIQKIYKSHAAWLATRSTYDYNENDQAGEQYGNPTRQTDSYWDPDNVSTAGDHWIPYRGTRAQFFPNTDANIVSLPARQITIDCKGKTVCLNNEIGKITETQYFYDNHSQYNMPPSDPPVNNRQPGAGKLTTSRTWVGGDNYAQISMTYDGFGNLTNQIVYPGYYNTTTGLDEAGAQRTRTTYDSGYHTYPVLVSNSLGQKTTTTYDYNLGLPDSVTDPNGANTGGTRNTTRATYDAFGRMTSIVAPYDSDTLPTLKITYYDQRKPFQVDLQQKINGTTQANSNWIQLSRFYDGTGKQIQSQTVGAIVNGVRQTVVTDSQYDPLGRLIQQTVPYTTNFVRNPVFITQQFNHPALPHDFTQAFTSTAYDTLSRSTQVTQPNGNKVQTAYDDPNAPSSEQRLTTIVTDPMGNQTKSKMDVWGRTREVISALSPSLAYEYDALGQLTSVTKQAPGGDPITTTLVYDNAGRKTQMTDPDMGNWRYQYDALGNLIVQIDAKRQGINLYYDALNRLKGKIYANGPVNPDTYTRASDNPTLYNVTYTYDIGANALGRRSSMQNVVANQIVDSTNWTYDERGRTLSEEKTINGAPQLFTTRWTYNSADLPVTMQYPDNETLTYHYDAAGNLASLTSSTGDVYAKGMKYDEAARQTFMILGNNIINRTFNYAPWTNSKDGGALKSLTASPGNDATQLLQSLSYDYDKNGNVAKITNAVAGETSQFNYDALNRLTKAWSTINNVSTYSESFDYDSNTGNLAHKGPIGNLLAYTYPTAVQGVPAIHPHAVIAVGGNTVPQYIYDENGNMTDRLGDGPLSGTNGFDRKLIYDVENRLISVSQKTASTRTNTPIPALTSTGTVTLTKTSSATPTPSVTVTLTNTNTVTLTVTETATASPSGTMTETPTPSPTATASGPFFLSVSAGSGYTCAIAASSAAQCWGDNGNNQLGDGSTTQRTAPVGVSGLSGGVTSIIAGQSHTCAITTSGAVQCWGNNASGQLGDGTTTQRPTPVSVSGLSSGATSLGLGSLHTCALVNGGVQCWGSNGNNQLGDGTTIPSNSPVNVSGLTSGVTAISAGLYHTCALTDTGGVKCWGLNNYGQLGDGTSLPAATPVDVIGLGSGVIAIAASGFKTCALTSAGAVKCWGQNTYGGLGDGTTTSSSTPVDVTGLDSGVSAIAGSGFNTCAMIASGVKCWGRNVAGQLGDGTTTDSATPVDVLGLSGAVASISVGSGHACALLASGNIQCWGDNFYGELGNDTTTDSSIPVKVIAPAIVATETVTPTQTLFISPTITPTPAFTVTQTPSPTASATSTQTATASQTPTVTATFTATPGTLVLTSTSANDGWVLESGENSGAGGTLDAAATTITVGDDASNKQYRGMLHFDTSALPDNAVITSVTLKIKKQSIVGTNPFTTHGDLLVDVNQPNFGANAALALDDFKAPADVSAAASFGTTPAGGWYSAALNNAGTLAISRTDTTQFRLRFATDDNNDLNADALKFFSGDAPVGSRPQLVITYVLATPLPTVAFQPTPTRAPFTGASYIYDGDGNMVKATVNGVVSYYPSRTYQITGTVVTKYYGSSVMRVGGTLYYLLSDQLGSASLTLNTDGQVVAELRYKAFGEVRYSLGNTPTDYRYTGQRQQADIGLYYYGARWYDPALGHFASADTIVPGVGSPQAYDRYAYVGNNPLRYSDPSGKCQIDMSGHMVNFSDGSPQCEGVGLGGNGQNKSSYCSLADKAKLCELTNGAFIDESHYSTTAAQILWDKLQKARHTGKTIPFDLPQESPGKIFTATYTIDGSALKGMTDKQLREVGLGIWLDFQIKYETWQGQVYPAFLSSFHREDIPSTYLAYVDTVMGNHQDYGSIVSALGGGSSSSFRSPWDSRDPSVENRTMFFMITSKDPPGYVYLSYPDALMINPAQNNGYWTFKKSTTTDWFRTYDNDK